LSLGSLDWKTVEVRESITLVPGLTFEKAGLAVQENLPPHAQRMTLAWTREKIKLEFKEKGFDLDYPKRPVCAFIHSAVRGFFPEIEQMEAIIEDMKKRLSKCDVIMSYNPEWVLQIESPYKDTEPTQQWRPWSAWSFAYPTLIPGPDVYTILVKDRPLNKASFDPLDPRPETEIKGNNLWSQELPLITSLGMVKNIYRYDFDPNTKIVEKKDPEHIWKKGDPPLGKLSGVNEKPTKPTLDEDDIWGAPWYKPPHIRKQEAGESGKCTHGCATQK